MRSGISPSSFVCNSLGPAKLFSLLHQSLKVVGNEKEGGSGNKLLLEYGFGLGDRCLFNFLCGRRLFFEVFTFPVCTAQFIGDWLENTLGAPNG